MPQPLDRKQFLVVCKPHMLKTSPCYSFWWAIPTHVSGGVPYYPKISPYDSFIFYRWCLPCFYKACLNTFGEHTREISGFKYRHDLVRDVLFDIFLRTVVYVKKEAHANFLTGPHEGRSTLKPTDILVYDWVGETCLCGLDWSFSTGEIKD